MGISWHTNQYWSSQLGKNLVIFIPHHLHGTMGASQEAGSFLVSTTLISLSSVASGSALEFMLHIRQPYVSEAKVKIQHCATSHSRDKQQWEAQQFQMLVRKWPVCTLTNLCYFIEKIQWSSGMLTVGGTGPALPLLIATLEAEAHGHRNQWESRAALGRDGQQQQWCG